MSALSVLIIRHAEKPGESWLGPGLTSDGSEDRTSLVIRGWQRAGAWSALFVVLLAGGLFQLLRRKLDTPAPTLLWYAGDLIGLWHDRGPDPAIATRSGPVSGQTG